MNHPPPTLFPGKKVLERSLTPSPTFQRLVFREWGQLVTPQIPPPNPPLERFFGLHGWVYTDFCTWMRLTSNFPFFGFPKQDCFGFGFPNFPCSLASSPRGPTTSFFCVIFFFYRAFTFFPSKTFPHRHFHCFCEPIQTPPFVAVNPRGAFLFWFCGCLVLDPSSPRSSPLMSTEPIRFFFPSMWGLFVPRRTPPKHQPFRGQPSADPQDPEHSFFPKPHLPQVCLLCSDFVVFFFFFFFSTGNKPPTHLCLTMVPPKTPPPQVPIFPFQHTHGLLTKNHPDFSKPPPLVPDWNLNPQDNLHVWFFVFFVPPAVPPFFWPVWVVFFFWNVFFFFFCFFSPFFTLDTSAPWNVCTPSLGVFFPVFFFFFFFHHSRPPSTPLSLLQPPEEILFGLFCFVVSAPLSQFPTLNEVPPFFLFWLETTPKRS